MNFTHSKINITLILLLISSCITNNQPYQKLNEFLKESNINFQEKHHLEWIMVIDERGCSSCNKKFANAIVPCINAENGIILISATGAEIDLSRYLSDSIHNVFGISKIKLSELNLLNGSGVIFLDNKIDTIVKINSNNFNSQLSFILSKIHNE